MGEIREVKVSDLLFWLENFRFGEAKSQKEALENLRTTKNFKGLVDSIKKYGFQANELLTVSPISKQPGKYLVYDGNRRLAAVKQISEIETLQVWVEEDTEALRAILNRAHSSGDPAGHLGWTAVQQARRDRSLFDKAIKTDLSDNAVALNIIEIATGESLGIYFPITTFVRVLLGYSEFKNKFGINKNGTKIEKKENIKSIVKDIGDKKINSRNINTRENITQYIDNLLAGMSQEDRCRLRDDNETEEEISEEEEQSPTRLLKPSQLRKLRHLIKNQAFIKEMEQAPIGKYPHLLFFALRAILDTLRNILDDPDKKHPKAFNVAGGDKYFGKDEEHYRGKIRILIERLGAHAHDVRNQASTIELNNNRDHFEALIDRMIEKYEKNPPKSKRDKK